MSSYFAARNQLGLNPQHVIEARHWAGLQNTPMEEILEQGMKQFDILFEIWSMCGSKS